jgi:GT2 family glycosyltransferase
VKSVNHKVHPVVYAVILNYNGWKDTVTCLESVFNSRNADCRVIVCDNHSTDDSFGHLRSYLNSRFRHAVWVSRLPWPDYRTARRVERAQRCRPLSSPGDAGGGLQEVVLVRTILNFGYAGGNNIGIAFALSCEDADYVWILNNDTIVEPHALAAMIVRLKAIPAAGICGSTLLYHADPRRIQSLGGARYLKWAGVGVQLGSNESWPTDILAESVENAMSYVSGASMLVSRKFLEEVGLMAEDYFLYFEEIDWAERAAGRFKLVYAPDSIVYHKEGGAIGSSRSGRHRSPESFFWLTRSRLLFTAKYHPEALPSVMFYSLMNSMQWAFLNRNPRILLAGIRAFADAGRSALRNRCPR